LKNPDTIDIFDVHLIFVQAEMPEPVGEKIPSFRTMIVFSGGLAPERSGVGEEVVFRVENIRFFNIVICHLSGRSRPERRKRKSTSIKRQRCPHVQRQVQKFTIFEESHLFTSKSLL